MFKRNYVKNATKRPKEAQKKFFPFQTTISKADNLNMEEKNDIVATIGKLETLANNSNNKKKNLLYVQKRNMKNASWRRMGPSVGCVGKGNKLVSPKTLKW
jgi:hypothetical protein